jgi:hypothetical protein
MSGQVPVTDAAVEAAARVLVNAEPGETVGGAWLDCAAAALAAAVPEPPEEEIP